MNLYLLYPVVTLLAAGAAYRVVTRWTAGALEFPERVAAGYLISGLVIYLMVAILAPWFLNIRTVALVYAVLLAGTAWGAPAFYRDLRQWGASLTGTLLETGILARAIFAAAVILALLLMLQSFAPPNTFDSLHYHLPLAKHDVEIGHAEVNWSAFRIFNFFPQFMGHQSRLLLVLDPEGRLAQAMHANLAIVAAIAGAGLARRAGLTVTGAWLAALFVLGNRAVVWQSGSAETDTALAAVAAMAMVAYLAWRERHDLSLMVLFGLFVGIGALVKYHGLAVGLAFAPAVLWDGWRGSRTGIKAILLAALVALAAMSPHLIRDAALTGNPIFPMFNSLFNPDQRPFFTGLGFSFGTGRGIFDLLAAPWMLSIFPTKYFDGMIFGTPYALALAPLALLSRPALRHWPAMLVTTLCYFAIWFFLMGQQTRFLLPVFPLMAVFCAAGATGLFGRVQALPHCIAAAVPLAVLLCVQGMFVAIYSALRLPPAIGLTGFAVYLDQTPTMNGANYRICDFVGKNLAAGEKYLSLLSVRFYCPQASAVYTTTAPDARYWLYSRKAPLSLDKEIENVAARKFRFVVVPIKDDPGCSDNETGCVSQRSEQTPLVQALDRVLPRLEPLATGPYAEVYDGRSVARALGKLQSR